MRVDLSDLPDDPLVRLAYLSAIEDEVAAQVREAYANAYFDARLTGQIQEAIRFGRHGRKKILALTRWLNKQRGSSVRWGDQLDRSSTAYDPDR